MPEGPGADEVQDSLMLIRGAQAGDHAALEDLFGRYYARLQRMVRPLLGPEVRGSNETGDVLQEALYEAIRDFDRFDISSRERFLALMRRIVENKICKIARYERAEKRDRRKEQALAFLADSMASGRIQVEPEAPVTSPSMRVERMEEVQVLEECIAELPATSQRVLRMASGGGYTWERIAELCDFKSPDAARMHYSRAKIELGKKLRARLGSDSQTGRGGAGG